MPDLQNLQNKATEIRMKALEMTYQAGAGHLGGSLSSTDILTALYYDIMKVDPKNPKWENRDRYIQSKGHAVEPLWAILADKGFFPKAELATFSQFGTRLIGHPNNKVPGVEMNTGSLGHGLSVASGMALSAKIDKKDYRVYTLMGDGELAEGSVWEGAMAAAHYKLDNLVAIIDRNKLQISGTTETVMGLEPLADKWASFGWEVVEIDGNHMESVVKALRTFKPNKPVLVLANTVKGKGISLAENVPSWHHHVPSEEQFKIAMDELRQQLEVAI